MPGGVLPLQLTVNACKHSYNVASVLCSGLCSPETPTLTELAESIDDTLFQHIMHTPHHVIHHLLPARHELPYNIRQRHHDRQLSIISGQLCNRNFIYHMLFKDCYQLRILIFTLLPTVLWRCWLGVRKGIWPVKKLSGGCCRDCLGWGADLPIAQQMPLPLTISCSSKFRLVLPFWYLLTRVVPDIFQKRSKTVVCVCLIFTFFVYYLYLCRCVLSFLYNKRIWMMNEWMNESNSVKSLCSEKHTHDQVGELACCHNASVW